MDAAIDLSLAADPVSEGLALVASDPLSMWTHAAPQLREATALTTQVTEISVRAPANGGKTEWGTAVILACCQGRRTLDGIPIPRWPGRVDALELARDYNEQKLASQQTYLRLLGSHPHKIRWLGNDIISSIRVRHADSDDDLASWSLIDFRSQENRRSGVGVRADIVRADEPPYAEIWHEVRKSAHANRRALRLLTFTPIKRPEWWWLHEEYGDGPRGRVRRVGKHWAEVRYSLHDNLILTPERKAELIDGYQREGTLIDARVHGDYVNTVGTCPFDSLTIQEMIAAWCRPPMKRSIQVPMESPDGEPKRLATIEVEYWKPPGEKRPTYQDIDPASGIDDKTHNPLALHLSDDESGELLVRWNGYAAPYTVGALAAALHRHYHEAATDIEMMDSWGINVYRGYVDNGGTNLCRERRELKQHGTAMETGFRVKAETRAIWVGCIQEWIAAFKAGTPYAICRSRAVFETLLAMELDKDDKPVAGPGAAHAEDFVLLGQKLRRLQRPRRDDPEAYVEGPSIAEQQMRRLFGDDESPRRNGRMLRPVLDRPR
jgi:hypothetical protein